MSTKAASPPASTKAAVDESPSSPAASSSRKESSSTAISAKKIASLKALKAAKAGKSSAAQDDAEEGKTDGTTTKKSMREKKPKKASGAAVEKDDRPLWKRMIFCYKRPPLKDGAAAAASDEGLLATAMGQAEEDPVAVAANIAEVAKEWEASFLLPLIDAHVQALSRGICATKIQRIVRGFIARRRCFHKREEAVQSFVAFWMARIEERKAQEAKVEEAKEITKQFAMSYAKETIRSTAREKIRDAAARRIQRFMTRHCRLRGDVVTFSTIALEPLRRRRERVPKPEKPKFSDAVQRLIWAKTSFEPEGGWPRPNTAAKYDLWEHIDKPPKEQKYGVRTKLVKAATTDANAREILKSDGTSWIAVPVQLQPSGPAKLSGDDYANRKFEASPYRPLEGVDRKQELLDAKKRREEAMLGELTDDQKLRKFGYYRFLKEQRQSTLSGGSSSSTSDGRPMVANVASQSGSPTRQGAYGGSMIQGGDSVELGGAPSIFGHTEIQQDSYFSSALNDSIEIDAKSPVSKARRGVKKQKNVESTLEQVSAVDVSKATGHDSNYPGFQAFVQKIQAKKRSKGVVHPNERDDIGHLKASSWGKIKAGVEERVFDQWERQGGSAAALDDVALGGAIVSKGGPGPSVANAACVWPTKPKKHYKLKYTWLPQPILKRAVENVYFDENVRNTQSSFVTEAPPEQKSSELSLASERRRGRNRIAEAASPVSSPSYILTASGGAVSVPRGGLLGAIEATSIEEYQLRAEASRFGGSTSIISNA